MDLEEKSRKYKWLIIKQKNEPSETNNPDEIGND